MEKAGGMMTKKEWEYLGFGFGAAVVLGFATWGAIELGKKVARKARDEGWFQREEEEDESEDESFVEKSINAMEEIVSPEFERNTTNLES